MSFAITILFALLLAALGLAVLRLFSRATVDDRMNSEDLESLRKRAGKGDGEAQYRMGVLSFERSDESEGFRWFLRSAEKGNGASQDAIGMLYELGRGVPRNSEEAARWYTKAAFQGVPGSDLNLGCLYALGRGVTKDYGEALKWFERAAGKDYPEGKTALAWFLATCPDGSIRDGKRAIEVLKPLVDGGERHYIVLDTLAAAYAEAKEFPEARKLMEEALATADRAAHPLLYGQMERRLCDYEVGRPWRQSPEETMRHPHPVEPDRKSAAPEEGRPLSAEEPIPVGWEDGESPGLGREKGLERAEERVDGIPVELMKAEDDGPVERSLSDQEPIDSVPQPHLDYIVEKLQAIEELLRPLQTEEGRRPDEEPVDSGSPEHEKTETSGPGESPAHEAGGSIAPPPTDRRDAVEFGLSFVEAMINDEYGEVYRKMEMAFRNAVPEDQIEAMIEQMYAAFGGKPLEAELKAEETGQRMYGGEEKQVYKFWYALRTAKHQKGIYSLFVEVLPEEDHLACSTFFVTPTPFGAGR